MKYTHEYKMILLDELFSKRPFEYPELFALREILGEVWELFHKAEYDCERVSWGRDGCEYNAYEAKENPFISVNPFTTGKGESK